MPTSRFLLVLALCSCSNDAQSLDGDLGAARSAALVPETLYRARNCITCHGRDFDGTMQAPPLRGLAAHWNATDLAAFLKEPKPWLAKEPRLAEAARMFRTPMPPTFGTDAERLALAQWLLAQP
ncbi:MAG: cytochrome c [Planctomycetes bacterium]|nr:cytochrome c [Planctomycetota bacterium]